MRNMVENNGLRVTVVLDSCHSGGVFRDGTCVPKGLTPRTVLDQFDDSRLESDETTDKSIDAVNPGMRETSNSRDVGAARKPWLLRPKGYTVLTACGTKQVARERNFGSSSFKQGVLTYSIIKILKRFAVDQRPSYAYVIDHVKYRIRDMGLKAAQDPMIYGDGLYEFFGTFAYFERATSYVLSRNGRTVELDVGAAQGVAHGALYDLIPSDLDFVPGRDKPHVQVQVTQVGTFKSLAKLLTKNENAGFGWLAVLRGWAFDPEVKVEFNHDHEQTRVALEEELRETPGLVLTDAKGEGTLTINADKDNSYGMFQGRERMRRLPRISVNDEFAAKKLAYVISYIARF
jgi:hypothetical protein